MENKYFVYDPNYGIEFFYNESDRDMCAEKRIEAHLDNGMWDEDAQEIVAGVVTHRVKEVNRQERPDTIDEEGFDEEGEWWDGDCTHKCRYVLDKIEDGLMNDTEKAVNYYRAAATKQRPDWVPCRVRLLTPVKEDLPFHRKFQDVGEHECKSNQWGAISVKATSGQMLGVMPAEFEVVAWRHNSSIDRIE